MSALPASVARSPRGRTVSLLGRPVPVVWPDRSDPRLRLAVVITILQVLGQTVLGFKLSIAQIIVSILVCAAVEIIITYRRQQALIWPSSAILTGNSIAFILRATGTQHGDWWSLNGIQFFIFAALVGILSKYLVRVGGSHLYNPSNIGLVVCLVVFGPAYVFPQYLWWGPVNPPIALAWAVIILGGIWVLRGLRMVTMVTSFLITFVLLIAVFALQDQCFYAVWRSSPVCGANYWLGIAASPEVAIFVLLMMSDPKTSPKGMLGRAIYGAATAAVAAGLIYAQPSEWGIKLALLASLTIVCSFVPLMKWLPQWLSARRHKERPMAPAGSRQARPAIATPSLVLSLLAVVSITIATPAVVIGAANDPKILAVDHPSSPDTPGLQ